MIVADSPGDDVIAVPAVQVVSVRSSKDPISIFTAIDVVGTGLPVQAIDSVFAVKGVILVSAEDVISATLSVDDIFPDAAVQVIATIAAGDRVVSSIAMRSIFDPPRRVSFPMPPSA